MKEVRVVFCRPKGFSLISSMFRLAEKANYSHVAIFIDNFYSHTTLFGRTHLNTARYFEKSHEIIHVKNIQVSDYNYDLMVQAVYACEGIEYGSLSVIGAGIARIFRAFGIKMPNIFKDKIKTFYCSEYGWYILNIGKVDMPNFDPEIDGPRKLFESLNAENVR